MKIRFLLFGLLLFFVTHKSFGQLKKSPDFEFPQNVGYVNDFEEVFTPKQKEDLEETLINLEKETFIEITVVSITSYAPYDNLFDYSLDLSNHWGIGKKGKNNGVSLVFGMKIKEIRIQVGNGLEDKLTDDEAKEILDQIIIPEFKKGEVYLGIKKGLMAIIKEVE